MPSTKINILISEPVGFPHEAAKCLSQVGELVFSDCNRPGLLSAAKQSQVLWVRLRHKIDAEVMAAAPLLQIIVTPTTGLNHIDVDEAESRGIRVLSLRDSPEFLREIRATAEHTLSLMLTLLRHIPAALDHVLTGGWERDLFQGNELYGKIVGIVGYGRLGRIVGRYLQAFDCRVLANDPNVKAHGVEPGVTMVSLSELLGSADLVTLHVNLDKKTRAFFGPPQFAKMKRGAWFINTSRGELINENALLKALQSGHLRGAALDVLCNEHSGNLHEHPVIVYAREHENLIITPHIGGCTVESMEKTEVFLAKKLRTCLSESSPYEKFL